MLRTRDSRRYSHLWKMLIGVLGIGMFAAGCGAAAPAGHTGSSRSPSTCVPLHHFKTVVAGQLHVAAIQDPPELVEKSNGQLGGIDGPLITDVAKLECLKLVVDETTAAAELQDVISGRDDIAEGGWGATAARAQVVGQTLEMYDLPVALISKGGKYDSLQALASAHLSVSQVSGEIDTAQLQQVLGMNNVVLFATNQEAWQALVDGRVAAYRQDYAAAAYLVRQNPSTGMQAKIIKPDPAYPVSLSAENINWPHTLGNTAMTKALNADLKILRKNGAIQASLKKWGDASLYPSTQQFKKSL